MKNFSHETNPTTTNTTESHLPCWLPLDDFGKHSGRAVREGVVSEQDVRQATVVRLTEGRASEGYDPNRGTPEGFVAGVRKNVRRELARKELRAARLPEWILRIEADVESPLGAAIRSEQLERVRDALKHLNPDDATLVLRRYGFAVGAVPSGSLTPNERCRLCRAMRVLRRLLRDDQ